MTNSIKTHSQRILTKIENSDDAREIAILAECAAMTDYGYVLSMRDWKYHAITVLQNSMFDNGLAEFIALAGDAYDAAGE